MARGPDIEPRPHRTKADTYRTGYAICPDFVAAKFDGPRIIKPPTEIRLRVEQRELRDRTGEAF